jgi:DNA glycosylase AlkZ-like
VAGHGPVSARDFARWSSLTVTRSREAFEAHAHRWERVDVAGETLWFSPEDLPDAADDRALLLPLYDEATLTYPASGFPVAAGHPHPRASEELLASVVVRALNIGSWRRTVTGGRMSVQVSLARDLPAPDRRSVTEAAEALAAFFDKALVLTVE